MPFRTNGSTRTIQVREVRKSDNHLPRFSIRSLGNEQTLMDWCDVDSPVSQSNLHIYLTFLARLHVNLTIIYSLLPTICPFLDAPRDLSVDGKLKSADRSDVYLSYTGDGSGSRDMPPPRRDQKRQKQGVLTTMPPIGKKYAVGRNNGGFTRCNPVCIFFSCFHHDMPSRLRIQNGVEISLAPTPGKYKNAQGVRYLDGAFVSLTLPQGAFLSSNT